jgi:hypothetical protein
MYELWKEALDLRPLLCVDLCLKNQNDMYTLVCSRPCLVLLSAYVGVLRRGLRSEHSSGSF